MKKGQIIEGYIEKVNFPNKGMMRVEDKVIIVKDSFMGQTVRACVRKVRKDKCEAKLLEVLQPSDMEVQEPPCPYFGVCGGCSFQRIPYKTQLQIKEKQVKELLDAVITEPYEFEVIKGSPSAWEYRNKMEFSFGDEYKEGPLALGLHKKGSFYDIVTADGCKIVEEDYSQILSCVLNHFQELGISYYKKIQHTGILRHLLIRKARKTQEILVALVTSSEDGVSEGILNEIVRDDVWEEKIEHLQKKLCINELVEKITALSLKGRITGILHVINDNPADAVKSDRAILLFGNDHFYEELLGLRFKISPFSFFQTNSAGAEVLYETAREFVGETENKVIFDLYSGTGTIAQILAPVAAKVIGIEIVEEAVTAARENAALNGLKNCEFIAGDVLKILDEVADKPDIILLDPPRDGCNPKALNKIIRYGVEKIIYISCKPTSLARDLEQFQACGYRVERICCIDMFPQTVHVETVALLVRKP